VPITADITMKPMTLSTSTSVLGHEAELVGIDDQSADAGPVRGKPEHHPRLRGTS
jgi:hypothetical protein